MNDEIIYSLNIEDVQTVARDVLDRELMNYEITEIKDLIAEKVNWFDAIEAAILSRIKP